MTAQTQIDRVTKGFRIRSNPDLLTVAVDADDDQISYRGILQGWAPGTRVEIDSELMLVTEVDTVNKVATVERGWLSTAAAHAQGAPIFLNSRITASDVLELFNDCLEDLFGLDLYRVAAVEMDYDPSAIGYELPAEAVEILRVDALKDSMAGYWEPIYDWLEVDNTNLSDFSTGRAVMMRVALPPGGFRVIYSMPFNRISSSDDDLEVDVGLRPYMFDLLFYFAMNRLMVDLERGRSQVESAQNHQRAQDSPPFLALRTGEWYQARYLDRVRTARAHQAKEVKKVRGTGYGS